MRLHIEGDGIRITQTLERNIRRRLDFALRKYGSQVQTVTVRLTDVNGPRGGVDKRCSITVGGSGWDVFVEDLDSDVFVLLSRSVARMSRSVDRKIKRARSVPSVPLRALVVDSN
ncbi:MAG: HPF/RaiA family ribosome-associated protein [Candidatus Eisenbacteria bacterium]|uniref:HPF/RaiA family ribosome-associated protein n=1 Tax=Eiseniibacteriota bacterium TaxID=2212470 RepID=A0A956RQE7_UNCEI|nr:HPF/RaiA family ribosome-associated protein [Candidatus Eisenbacteria bacterium]